MNQYEHLKAEKGLTQKNVAEACGTTQSAISRLERMRGKPTYELLRRLSTAVGGELYLLPVSDVEYRNAFAESDYKLLVTLGNLPIPMGEYGGTSTMQGKTPQIYFIYAKITDVAGKYFRSSLDRQASYTLSLLAFR